MFHNTFSVNRLRYFLTFHVALPLCFLVSFWLGSRCTFRDTLQFGDTLRSVPFRCKTIHKDPCDTFCDSFSADSALCCAVVPAAPFMVHYPRTMSVGWLVGIVQLHDIIGEMRPDNAACIPPHELMPRSWTEPNIYSKLLHRGSCSTLTKQQMSAAPSAAHLAVCVAAPVALLSVALPAEAFTSLAAVLFHSVPRSFSRVNSFARFMFRFSLCCFLVASLVSVVPVVTVRCAVLPLGPFGV